MSRMLLPQFSNINISEVEGRIDQILQQNLLRIEALLSSNQNYTWENLLAPMEQMDEALKNFWSTITHLGKVVHSTEIQEVVENCSVKVSDYESKKNQNVRLYAAIKSVKDNVAYFDGLSVAQQSAIDQLLKEFKLSGVHLPDAEKSRIAELKRELEILGSQFDNNVMRASQAWKKHIIDENEMAGIPAYVRESAREKAATDSLDGWIFTLDESNVFAILTHADSRKLRHDIHKAYKTRASTGEPDSDEGNNYPIMHSILERRIELARILGFSNYAQYSLQTKMLDNTDEVLSFLGDIAQKTIVRAETECMHLASFASSDLGITELHPWDFLYAREKLRGRNFDFSQEALRPYFSEPSVFNGLRGAMEKLYGVTLCQADGINVWDENVKFYTVLDRGGQLIAGIYFDLYERKNKEPGAWMSDCRFRYQLADGSTQLPVAYVNCNFNPPAAGKPALLLHDDVVTIFHETGHALQHILTQVDIPSVSGITGIPDDAIEIASQFFENWAKEKASLCLFARHYETDEPISEALFERMQQADKFQSAIDITVQLLYALFDFRLHMEYNPNNPHCISEILQAVRSNVCVLPVADYDRFEACFSHVFSNGCDYSAGYYGYLWSEVMAADLFSVFKQNGIFDMQTGNKFKATFLESGGTRAPMDLFVEFCGRKPSVNAFLDQKGIMQRRRERSESPLSQFSFVQQNQHAARLHQERAEAAQQNAATHTM